MEVIIREAVASDDDDLRALYDKGDVRDVLHREHLPRTFQKSTGATLDRDHVLGLIADETVGLFVAQGGTGLAFWLDLCHNQRVATSAHLCSAGLCWD